MILQFAAEELASQSVQMCGDVLERLHPVFLGRSRRATYRRVHRCFKLSTIGSSPGPYRKLYQISRQTRSEMATVVPPKQSIAYHSFSCMLFNNEKPETFLREAAENGIGKAHFMTTLRACNSEGIAEQGKKHSEVRYAGSHIKKQCNFAKSVEWSLVESSESWKLDFTIWL